MNPPQNVGAERRGPVRPTLRGALPWAVVGAALFLGAGAALPVWTVGYVHPVTPDWAPLRGPLWEALRLQAEGGRRVETGHLLPVHYGQHVVGVGPLLIGGGLAGLLGYFVRLAVRDRKGGGA